MRVLLLGGGVCVGGTGRRRRRENCAWDVLSKRRINLSRKKALGL